MFFVFSVTSVFHAYLSQHNNVCKQWKNRLSYRPCPRDCGEFYISKDIITGPFNKAEQDTSLKIRLDMFWGMLSLGLIAFHSFFTLIK